jgi:cytoskeleton protein RodZ
MNTVGEKLKKERIQRGISLDQMAASTRIQKKFLQALEEGRYEVLPASVFIVGFIRSYSAFLGVDASPLVAEYEADRQALKPTVEPFRLPSRRRAGIKKLPLVAGAFVIIAVVAGGVAYYRSTPTVRHEAAVAPPEEDLIIPTQPSILRQEKEKSEPSAEEVLEQALMPSASTDFRAAEEAPTAGPKTMQTEEENAPKAAEPKAEPQKVKIIVQPEKPSPVIQSQPQTWTYFVTLSAKKEDVWIYAVIDENDVRDMYIRSGKSVIIRGNKSFSLTTGNALHLDVKVNGKHVRIPGSDDNKVVRNWLLPLER